MSSPFDWLTLTAELPPSALRHLIRLAGSTESDSSCLSLSTRVVNEKRILLLQDALSADCKHIPMDLCHQKPPASIPTSTDLPKQLPTAPTRHVSKPGLSPRSPPRKAFPTNSIFTSCSDYEGNGLKPITRDPHSHSTLPSSKRPLGGRT
ncbi:hypothetical protein SDJN03_17103, partial [Cucurbita argyrosperma subsp. sororia]